MSLPSSSMCDLILHKRYRSAVLCPSLLQVVGEKYEKDHRQDLGSPSESCLHDVRQLRCM